MKEIQTPRGILKYRMPNILEAYDILDASGISEGAKLIKVKRNIIKSMGELVDFSGVEGITCYEDLFQDLDQMVLPLNDIAGEVLSKLMTTLKKKSI